MHKNFQDRVYFGKTLLSSFGNFVSTSDGRPPRPEAIEAGGLVGGRMPWRPEVSLEDGGRRFDRMPEARSEAWTTPITGVNLTS